MQTTTLVILARAPELGRVKTRLAKGIGERPALAVYRELLHRTARAAADWPGPVLLATTGNWRTFLGTGLERHKRIEQSGGNLGDRITAAMQAGQRLARSAIAIGTDCPALDVHSLQQVVDAERSNDAAFGPTHDGGFWAMASSSEQATNLLRHPTLPWSSADTLAAIRTLLQEQGLTSGTGPTLGDVDTAADLEEAVRDGLIQKPSDFHA